MEVGVALPMCVAYHVHGHPIDGDVDIGAMIDIEATEKDLFRLTTPCVLTNKQSRHLPEQFLRRFHRVRAQVDVGKYMKVFRFIRDGNIIQLEGNGLQPDQ